MSKYYWFLAGLTVGYIACAVYGAITMMWTLYDVGVL